MHAFGVSEWKDLGPPGRLESPANDGLSLLVEIQGQHYVLKERVEGLIEEDSNHRYVFRHFLQQAGIPVPSLWLTPQGEPAVVVGDDYFDGGRVVAWRCLLVENGRIVAETRSFLWR